MAFGAWLIAVVALTIGLLAWLRSGAAPSGYIFMSSPAPMVAFAAMGVSQASIGLVMMIRLPGHVTGRMIMGFAVIIGLAGLVLGLVPLARGGNPDLASWLAWLGSWIFFPTATAMALGLALVFPDGKLPSPGWRDAQPLIVSGATLTACGIALTPGELVLFPGLHNPLVRELPAAWAFEMLTVAGFGLLAVGGATTGLAMIERYRRSSSEVRRQIGWYLASGTAMLLAFLAFLVAVAALPHESALGETIETVFFALAGAPPFLLLYGIRRYGLYDIDHVVGRAFVYGALTAVLAGVYTAAVRLFNWIFSVLTGETSDLALVLTTLLLATTFTPIKRLLEDAVQRGLKPEDAELSAEVAAVLASPQLAAMIDSHLQAALATRAAVRQSPEATGASPNPPLAPSGAATSTSPPAGSLPASPAAGGATRRLL